MGCKGSEVRILSLRPNRITSSYIQLHNHLIINCKDAAVLSQFCTLFVTSICIKSSGIFYIFALRPEEEQNTNKIFELLNNEIDEYEMIERLPKAEPKESIKFVKVNRKVYADITDLVAGV